MFELTVIHLMPNGTKAVWISDETSIARCMELILMELKHSIDEKNVISIDIRQLKGFGYFNVKG